jgi:peptide/nickel transport system substrate-binding protein
MKHGVSGIWRTARATLVAAGLALVLSLAGRADADSVLRIVPHADLKNIDPIWTTAYITRNHGYMVYDTLFALDETLTPQPQMVDTYDVSDDGLVWSFTLRDGLKWHDGTPVTAEDCIASIARWGARDGMGQKLMDFTAEMNAVDDKTFELHLNEPYGLVLDSLGKLSSNVPFMMPKRLAETDPFEQVPEIVGSGPFKFVREEWVPGNKVVYVKNEDYVPRDEPPSYLAGGKVAKVDRVEWLYIPDAATAMNALINNEIDFYEIPPIDLLPILEATPNIKVERLDPFGVQGWIRLNHMHPPFDNVKARQAMMWLVNQADYLQAVVGNPDYYGTCPAFFACGGPHETDVGADALMGFDADKAKALFEEAGYDGRPVVIMQATDIPINSGASLLTAQMLRKAGINVELQAMDWSTLTSRRAMDTAPADGGWNIFITWWSGADGLNPVSNIGVSGGCRERAWFGWPCDEKIEQLRDAYARASTPEEKQRLAEEVQMRAYEIVTYINFGQWQNPVAYRDSLTGMVKSPVFPLAWNIEKH